MPEFDSTQAAKQADPTAKNLLNSEEQNASLVYCEAEYIAAGTEVANDTVRLFKIPVGYRAVSPLWSVDTDGLAGTSTIISLGTAAVPAAFGAALDITAAGLEQCLDSGSESLAPATATVDGDYCYATFTTSTATPTAAQTFIVRAVFAKA